MDVGKDMGWQFGSGRLKGVGGGGGRSMGARKMSLVHYREEENPG